ncbi:MAG: hypothetical protein C4575_00165 [Desulforudis sp.]|jgi:hypothetical protein|nr:hypothetical protein [Clostridia bacterium]MDQ7791729.1 hypothetical protein [Clostridia bacterium]RJX22890.1 MAG: hypothetical protein C4575_00165 [Desulforudis sp.]
MYKVNLLPDELQKGALVDLGRIKKLAAVVVIGLVVIGGFGFYLVKDYSRLTQQAQVSPDPAPVAAESGTAAGKEDAKKAHHVLPETTRVIDKEEAEFQTEPQQPDGVTDPFVGPMVLTGVVYSGGDGDLAIIEAGKTAYVVNQGDTVAGVWTVAQIGRDAVVLEGSEERKMRLELTGR